MDHALTLLRNVGQTLLYVGVTAGNGLEDGSGDGLEDGTGDGLEDGSGDGLEECSGDGLEDGSGDNYFLLESERGSVVAVRVDRGCILVVDAADRDHVT